MGKIIDLIGQQYGGNFLPYDIFISIYNLFIEVNGEQHYKFVPYFHRNTDVFKYKQGIDNLKIGFAQEHGYFLEIDLRVVKTLEQAVEILENFIQEIS